MRLVGVIRLLNVYKLIREPAVIQSASASSGNSATRSRAIENFSVACVWCTRGKVRFSRNLVVAPKLQPSGDRKERAFAGAATNGSGPTLY